MVGKLIKYELKALLRITLYVGIGALVVAVIGRIILAASPNTLSGTLFGMLAIYAACVALIMSFVASVSQFFRSFFTGEGYLTFSLPATPSQLIVAKLISALISTFYGAAVAVLSILIFASGISPDLLEEMGVWFAEYWKVASEYLSSDPLLIVEYICRFLVGLPVSLLFFYLLISVGQLFTNGRKALVFILTVAALIALSVISVYLFDPLMDLLAERVSVHLANWTIVAVFLGCDLGMFFLIRYILMHRVNLIV